MKANEISSNTDLLQVRRLSGHPKRELQSQYTILHGGVNIFKLLEQWTKENRKPSKNSTDSTPGNGSAL